MTIILATDAFPPHAGGSGWSTYELARGLKARGHAVHVLKVTAGRGGREQHTSYEDIPVLDFPVYAPNVPAIRNYFKNERLYPKVAAKLGSLIRDTKAEIVHGQHVLSAPPAVDAARQAGIPSVVTVRDYWPVCYRSDLLHTPRTLPLCPGCARAAAMQHGPPRIGLTGLGLLLVRRYLSSNLAMKVKALASADAVIAVSSAIGRDLRERAPELARTRLEIIPNPVSIDALRQRVAPRPMAEPYALYVGKLAVNKGTDHLVDVVRSSELDWPLMILGDGPDRPAIEKEAARAGINVRFLGWRDQVEVATWIAHAGVLIFPSRGPESLSRVLIEASALGVPIAAMNTGGTADIIEDEVTGLLSDDPTGLAEDVRRIRFGEVLRQRLGAAAAQRSAERFDAPAVVARIESLYRELLAGRRP
jgi:glycogen(starch) synthase